MLMVPTRLIALMLGGLSAAAHAQSPNPLMEYAGSYICIQGQTQVTLRIVRTSNPLDPNVTFSFGPEPGNPRVPTGSFWARAIFGPGMQSMTLVPVDWITKPPGFTMIGLQGTSADGGFNYDGQVTGGTACTTFSIHRTQFSTPLQDVSKRPPVSTSQVTPGREEISLNSRGGVLVVPVQINGALTLDFMIDSGASDVAVPADVVMTLIRTGTLQSSDFLGSETCRLADGSTVPSATFRIRTLRVGAKVVHDVTGSVAPVAGSLLLGQSFLRQLSSWSIDNRRHVLILE